MAENIIQPAFAPRPLQIFGPRALNHGEALAFLVPGIHLLCPGADQSPAQIGPFPPNRGPSRPDVFLHLCPPLSDQLLPAPLLDHRRGCRCFQGQVYAVFHQATDLSHFLVQAAPCYPWNAPSAGPASWKYSIWLFPAPIRI